MPDQPPPDHPNRKPNHLRESNSPYLRQHMFNAVDWYPWTDDALKRARTLNRPIFLSIGYSTCHWCHVMEEQSFNNDAIGDFLNRHFVSIKIDRESRPDLDEQFMLVTQMMTGNGGWPNSLFLTPDAQPFYAGTYFPPDAFFQLINRIHTLWESQPHALKEQAEKITSAVSAHLNRTRPAQNLKSTDITAATHHLLKGVDPTHGGFGRAPKFPRETTLCLLLDQAERNADTNLLATVSDALHAMIRGGMHDQIGGGFHRYSVDAAWQVPHFEKMLYNQALIGDLLTRSYALRPCPHCRRAALRTFDFVLREMTAPDGGFYAALDADSPFAPSRNEIAEKTEGAFYVWTPDQVKDALPDHAEFLCQTLNITTRGNFSEKAITNASVPRLTSLEAEPEGAISFYQRLDPLLESLFQARATRPPPHRDEKIIMDWNAMMIIVLARASTVFDRPDYYRAARKAARFLLGPMKGATDPCRIFFEGTAEIPAFLSDHAGLGLACHALMVHAPDQGTSDAVQWQQRAEQIATRMLETFGSAGDGPALLRASATPDGLGSSYPLDDGEVPSGNSLALRLLTRLAHGTGNSRFDHQAAQLAAATAAHALESPGSRAGLLSALDEHIDGPVANPRLLAQGKIRAQLSRTSDKESLLLVLDIMPGWHISTNAETDGIDDIQALQLRINGAPLDPALLPEPEEMKLAFSPHPQKLYRGRLPINVPLPAVRAMEQNTPIMLTLTIQACSDSHCLAPQDTHFVLWPDNQLK